MKLSVTFMLLTLLPVPAVAQERPTLSLDALVREAVRRHPALRSARLSAAAAWQVPPRVGSLPDPMFDVAVRNFRVDHPGLDTDAMSGVELGLSQDVPFPGKLGRRSAVAGARARVADREVGVVQASVAVRVRRDYWELHFAERARQITAENEKVLETITDIVTARFTLGMVPQQDVHQAQLAQSRVRALLEERAQAVRSARRELNSAVGRAPDADLPPTAAPPGAPALDRGRLLASTRERNPRVTLDRAQTAAAERSLAEARYDRWPDFQLAAGYMFRAVVPGDPTSGTDMFGASFGLTLPVWLWRKQNARVRETWEELAAAKAALEATDLDATTQLETMVDMLERLNREIALYDKDVLPHADQALTASTADYQVGKTSFVSLLQNWQALLDAQLDAERLRADRAEKLAELRALIGEDSP